MQVTHDQVLLERTTIVLSVITIVSIVLCGDIRGLSNLHLNNRLIRGADQRSECLRDFQGGVLFEKLV